MPAPINPLKKALNAGETCYGCWMDLADPTVAEILGMAGFDWLMLDGEHAPYDIRAITTQLQVLAASDTHPIVRVPVGDTYLMKQVLDAGAQTVLVPMVETADHARQLVRDVRYPPHGDRGVANAVVRAGGFSTFTDYVTTADAQICLMVQVENRKGLGALDEILTLDGIDGVFIGPADLAADMGHIGDTMHPAVMDAIIDAITRIDAAGKVAGFLSSGDEMTQKLRAAGARFIGVGSDVLLLLNSARTLAATYKENT